MWKTIAAISTLSVGCRTLGGCDEGSKGSFIVCESTYALCTAATCTPEDGSTDMVS